MTQMNAGTGEPTRHNETIRGHLCHLSIRNLLLTASFELFR